MGKIEGSVGRDSLKSAIISGGAAGNHVLTGIKLRDSLRSVLFNNGSGVVSNLTAEFTISADNQINNSGGTSSVGGTLEVLYNSAN